MRIALDATPLIEPAGGLPRYVTELALALAIERPDDEIHLLSDQTTLYIDKRLRHLPNIRMDPPAQWGRSKWWSLGLPFELRRRNIDVFHGTNFEVPYLKLTPAVMTIHDLSPWKPPPLRPPGCERVRSRTPRLIRLARRVITPTETIRGEVIEEFHVDEERVVAVPHAPSAALAPPAEAEGEAIRQRLGLRQPYLLAIGAGNERKNIPTLMEAWRSCRKDLPELGLAIIGHGAPSFNDPSKAVIRCISEASDAETAAALAGAAAFVYPSLYEGFGLPLVEAMRSGIPVIASTDPALVEVAGGAALHFDPHSQPALEAAITKLVGDPREAARRIEAGRLRVADLTWKATAQQTRAIYEQAIRRK